MLKGYALGKTPLRWTEQHKHLTGKATHVKLLMISFEPFNKVIPCFAQLMAITYHVAAHSATFQII